MSVDPKTRGLEEVETSSVKVVVPVQEKPLIITKVIGSGPSWIHVEMDDKQEYKISEGSSSWRQRNLGNLMFGEFTKSRGALAPGNHGLAIFPTEEMSRKAHRDLLFTSVRGYDKMTLIDAIRKYAPFSDGNDPDAYAHFVAKSTHVSFLKFLNTFSEDEKDVAIRAMEKMEGYKVGLVEKVKK